MNKKWWENWRYIWDFPVTGGGGGGGGGGVDDSVVGKLHGLAGNSVVWGQATALLCDYIRFSMCLNWNKLQKIIKYQQHRQVYICGIVRYDI